MSCELCQVISVDRFEPTVVSVCSLCDVCLMLRLTVTSIGLDDYVDDRDDLFNVPATAFLMDDFLVDLVMAFVMDVSNSVNSVGSVNAEHDDADNDP